MRFASLWCLFFVICLGLGYPTLNRYDPTRRDPDTVQYREMVIHGSQFAPPHFAHRVLIPYAAHVFFKLAENRVGSWDAGYFGLLIVNAFFMSGAAALLFVIASIVADANVGLLASTLYLLNYAVPNLFLIGFVDSGEAFFLMALIWAALSERWWVVPFAIVLGTLAKESFLVLGVTFSATWAVVDSSGSRVHRMLFVGLGAALGVVALLFVFNATSGSMAALVSDGSLDGSKLRVGFAALTHRAFWFAFAFLLPLGAINLRNTPRAWRYSTATAAVVAFVLVVYLNGPADAGPALVRPIFSIAAPLLTYSIASFMSAVFGVSRRPPFSKG